MVGIIEKDNTIGNEDNLLGIQMKRFEIVVYQNK